MSFLLFVKFDNYKCLNTATVLHSLHQKSKSLIISGTKAPVLMNSFFFLNLLIFSDLVDFSDGNWPVVAGGLVP